MPLNNETEIEPKIKVENYPRKVTQYFFRIKFIKKNVRIFFRKDKKQKNNNLKNK